MEGRGETGVHNTKECSQGFPTIYHMSGVKKKIVRKCLREETQIEEGTGHNIKVWSQGFPLNEGFGKWLKIPHGGG